MAKIAPALGDAARVLGCGPPAVAGRVHLPLLRPSLISASLLVLVDVMKELPATLILRPFNFDTLAVEAFQLATTERLDGAALPSLVIVAVGLARWSCSAGCSTAVAGPRALPKGRTASSEVVPRRPRDPPDCSSRSPRGRRGSPAAGACRAECRP